MKIHVMIVFESAEKSQYHFEEVPENMIDAFKASTPFYRELKTEEREESK